ncbi:hypothetical protein A9W98_13450 [Mycobacterium gordonae]|uniref:Uncharacterized protein n=1 Tax=Mycobacterium gordonae TaxID=1778 RepID=A0A1A6BK58_MYCGO|nr:hypothetical protein [Mycobacterium sp.]OBS02718.1 hypothetical protein A9W98_13450 [Mycobacterium gordonae]
MLTLRSADARFRQDRLDARDDKLRGELATLLTAEGERGVQNGVTWSRLVGFVEKVNFDELTDEQLAEVVRSARQIVFEEMTPIYRRIGVSGLNIRLLTENRAITRPVEMMQAAMAWEQRVYMDVLSAQTIRHLTWNILLKHQKQPDIWFEMATTVLVDYCIKNLTTGVPDMQPPPGWPFTHLGSQQPPGSPPPPQRANQSHPSQQ